VHFNSADARFRAAVSKSRRCRSSLLMTDASRHPQRDQEAGAMKYVMLIFDTPTARELSPEERQAWSSEIFAWYEKQGGTGTLSDGGAQLQGPETARTVRGTGVTDGPFMEAKEVLGGYSVLETDTYDQAVEITRTWPGVDRGLITIELRPVVQF
jgi:hypothetical protein